MSLESFKIISLAVTAPTDFDFDSEKLVKEIYDLLRRTAGSSGAA
jgi:hypothetical protein